MYCSNCDMPKDKQYFSKPDQDAAEEGKDEDFVCLHCSGGKPVRTEQDAVQYRCRGVLCNHTNLPYYHFFQEQLTAWKQNDTVDVDAKCARCVVRQDPEAAGVEFDCHCCEKKKHISDSNPVTIRSWKEGKKGEMSHWMCFDCLHPACGKCGVSPVFAVVHNSWITQQEYYQHAKSDSICAKLEGNLERDTAALVARGESVWFCSKCVSSVQ